MGTRKLHIAAIALIAVASLALSCGNMYSDLIETTRTLLVQCTGLRVIYVANGSTAGTVPMDVACYQENDLVTVMGNIGALRGALIQDGICQRFTGWNTDAGGTGTPYLPGDEFTIGAQNVTLYAQYTTDGSVLGKIGPASGWVFYDAGSAQPWGRYMEAAPNDLGPAPFGCPGVHLGTEGGTGTGAGLNNTNIIVAGCGDVGICAKLCVNYSFNGFTDWFMPSRQETSLLCTNLASPGIGDFHTAAYWSSTEILWPGPPAIWDAYYYEFPSGGSFVGGRDTAMWVRPIRYF